jgi:hypothetical protein
VRKENSKAAFDVEPGAAGGPGQPVSRLSAVCRLSGGGNVEIFRAVF